MLLESVSLLPEFLFCFSYRQSEGLSGRTLRKIPFLEHAHYTQVPQVLLEEFIKAMHKAVTKQLTERKDFSQA
jgi:hypothetical protein